VRASQRAEQAPPPGGDDCNSRSGCLRGARNMDATAVSVNPGPVKKKAGWNWRVENDCRNPQLWKAETAGHLCDLPFR